MTEQDLLLRAASLSLEARARSVWASLFSGSDTGRPSLCDGDISTGGSFTAPSCAAVQATSSSRTPCNRISSCADGGKSFAAARVLQAAFPVRSTQVVATSGGAAPVVMIAAGGNFFSAQGGIYSSFDLGQSWSLDIDLGEEVKACRSLALPALNVTRVYCVSAGQKGGSIVSADVPM